MDAEFWIKAWEEGRTAFHQNAHHGKLEEYFPLLDARAGQRILVPLCGKSKDLPWLHRQGLRVHGVELHDRAVRDFFTENGLVPVALSRDADFVHRSHSDIVVSCGDFFKLADSEAYDLIYDRAALVALPAPMRKRYAQVLARALKPGGKYLLIVYEYDPARMEGPPFSVPADEVHELYRDRFAIRLLESARPANEGARLGSVPGLTQSVYLLQRLGGSP